MEALVNHRGQSIVMANGNPQTEREALLVMQQQMLHLQQSQAEMQAQILRHYTETRAQQREDMKALKELLEDQSKRMVTQLEFDPVKRIVYGLVGLVLTSVLVALVALVIGGVG